MATKLTGGGTVFADNENSMAAAIERQLNKLLGANALPTEDSPEAQDRRRMFAAIARGVVEHLARNPEALKVVITQAPGGNTSQYQGRVVIETTDVTWP